MTSSDFIKKFENIKGYYNITPYSDAVGFSMYRDLNVNDKNNASLISFYVEKNDSGKLKKLIGTASYGKKVDQGISIRSGKLKISEPIDISSDDDYFYDSDNDKIFKNNKEISPEHLINDLYNSHIKTTKFWRGLLIRSKLFFWRILISNLFKSASIIFHFLLYFISGDRYSYEPIGETETLNGTRISSKFDKLLGLDNKKFKEGLIEVDKFDFLGYKASFWLIIFYSVFHLSVYIFCYYQNYRPQIILNIFENNFLTLVYVVLSFWFLEKMIPLTLKFLIRFNSEKSSYFSYNKRIKV